MIPSCQKIFLLVFNSTTEIPIVSFRSVKSSIIIFLLIHFMKTLLSFHFSLIKANKFFFDDEFSVSIFS